MKFKLNGESFELTPDLVRRKLGGHVPEAIREYWVQIDDVKWPVKQVLAIATGLRRTSFQSQNSRRLLGNLGFAVGTGAEPGAIGKVARAPRCRGQSSTLMLLKSSNRSTSVVAFDWLGAGPITLDDGGLPKFPSLPRLPGLYRYDFGLDASGTRTLYIGESVELARRASNYRNAKTDRSRQRTSRRIHKEIVGHLSSGGSIQFAIATSVRWGDDEELDLRLKSARRLAENAAVLVAQTTPSTRVLNIDADLAEPEADE